MKHASDWTACLLLLTLAVACDDEPSSDPAPLDAETPAPDMAPPEIDAAPVIPPDAGPPADAAPPMPDANPADAYVPVQPDEAPTEGEATLEGPDDLTEAVVAGARAGKVDEVAEALTGPEARCRVGGFRLDNAEISVCLQGRGTYSQYTFQGGNIVDAHLAGSPGSDQLEQHFVAPGVGEVSVESMGIVRDGSDGGPAIIRTEGRAGAGRLIKGILAGPSFVPVPFWVVTEYRLAPGSRHVDVLSWITADEQSGLLALMADVVLFGPRMQRITFGEVSDVELSSAWSPVVAYGWQHLNSTLDGQAGAIDLLPFLPAVHAGFPPLRLGDTQLLRRRFWVAPDVEAMREVSEDARPVVLRGPAGASVVVHAAGGPVVTQAQLVGGERTVRLEPGSYIAEVVGWPGGPVPGVAFESDELELELPVPGRLRIVVEDPDGRLVGGKVRLSGMVAAREVFVAGQRTVELPAGAWQAVTTRGWHFRADRQAVDVVAGGDAELRVVLERVIETAGWATGEFHQHASPSFDSEVPVEQRVMGNLAEGVDFMVPSDHDIIFDYASLIERMGVRDHVTAPLTGSEVSPLVTHVGAYGMDYDPEVGAGGSPPLPYQDEDGNWHIRRVPELVAEARARGAEIIQINHPRSGSPPTASAFFIETGFDPEAPLEGIEHHNWTTDFDSVEVFNDRDRFCIVLRDWFGLLNQGKRVTGIGNSDTHGRDGAGHPRNYLPTAAARSVQVSAEEIVAGVREGRVSVGGGAFLDLPDGPLFGDTVAVADGVWRVRVRLRTPEFTDLTRVVAFHNGRAVLDRTLDGAAEVLVDLDEVLEVPVDGDGYVVFVAVGDRGTALTESATFAFSNPVWVDADGEGVTPPGPMPVPLPDFGLCR